LSSVTGHKGGSCGDTSLYWCSEHNSPSVLLVVCKRTDRSWW